MKKGKKASTIPFHLSSHPWSHARSTQEEKKGLWMLVPCLCPSHLSSLALLSVTISFPPLLSLHGSSLIDLRIDDNGELHQFHIEECAVKRIVPMMDCEEG